MGRDSHRFDKWMVKFLTAHALPLEDKVDGSYISGEEQYTVPRNHQLERSRVTQSLIVSLKDNEAPT